ncbi:hypothetical protein RER_24720 [Rhodococcus erythropolis PR4]|uniref:AP2/ERF domain-containing protein n=1 Tax=Rhodococcus erythropolis (strain PR4 / NBRC 100887) TaxID=234621 RepID=C0ZXU5_RHOE4|nr:hypothetical protein RER_24720 [Rhodococcus erythropolis PR4]
MSQVRCDKPFCGVPCAAASRSRRSGAHASEQAKLRRADLEQPRAHKLVPLTRNGVATVDNIDFEYIRQFNWSLVDKGYARRTIKVFGRPKNERMHRVIAERVLGVPIGDKVQVDHKDGDRLNNCRSNLRVATHNQNSFNTRRKSKYGFKGVGTNHDRFQANIKAYQTKFYIGTFDTPEEAAWMRDQWAIELHGDFALLNFTYE